MIATITLTVLGMTCDGCVKGVKNALNDITGVSSVEVNLAQKCAVIEYDDEQTNKETFISAIEEAGFDVA